MSTRLGMAAFSDKTGRGRGLGVKIMKGIGLLSCLLLCIVIVSVLSSRNSGAAAVCDCASCHGANHHGDGWAACQTCHSSPPNTGAHSEHAATLSNTTYGDTITSTASEYRFGCGHCHSLDVSKHNNGTVNIELYNPNASKRGTSGTQVCSDCHGSSGPHGANCNSNSGTSDCLSCHSIQQGTAGPIIQGTKHHSTACTNCHGTSTWPLHQRAAPPACTACHAERISSMSHPQLPMLSACEQCHSKPGVSWPGVLPLNVDTTCGTCHGGGTNPIDNPPAMGQTWRSHNELAERADGIHRMTPDLVIYSLTAPSMANPGQSISVSEITRNRIGMADPSTTAFYLSTTTDLSGQVGGVLATRSVPALGYSSNSPTTGVSTTSVTIPGGTAAGTYYIIAKADDGGVVAELNETNNTRASGAISVVVNNVDLVIMSVAAPTSAKKGTTISLTDATKNRLTNTAGGSTTAAYLSSTCTTTPSGSPIGTRSVPSLGSGATSTGTISAAIPSGTVAGSYYIIWNANDGHTIAETDYTNNTKCKAITITN